MKVRKIKWKPHYTLDMDKPRPIFEWLAELRGDDMFKIEEVEEKKEDADT